MLRYASVGLFVERAQAANAESELTRENAGKIAEIRCRLDGLPLAIELATRVRLLPAADAVAAEPAVQRTDGGRRDLPERQRTLRSTLDWRFVLTWHGPWSERYFPVPSTRSGPGRRVASAWILLFFV